MTLKNRKTSAESYQVLSERDHIRKRVGMYAGQIAPHTGDEYVFNLESKKMEKRSITYVPALIKIFSEILDNSIDEFKRHPEILDTIRVDISETEISISDNGAGIPVELHPVTGTYVPETVFTNLRAGSNFNDDEERMTIGTNGVGSSIAVILSSFFKVDTCDGKKRFSQEYLNGLLEKTDPKIKAHDKHGTKVTFVPDFEYFSIKNLNQDHIQKMIKRVVDVAGCNPSVKFYINGERLNFKSFTSYIEAYQDEYVYEENENWQVGIAHSGQDTFEQISFVNSVETYNGGNHVEYVYSQVANKLREFFKKKHKIDVTPGMIKNHIRLFISCNIDKPKFNSQTKDCMVSEVKNFGTTFTVSDKMIAKLVKSPVIQSVLDWVQAKEDAANRAKERELNKDLNKANLRKITKFTDATEKEKRNECMLFICEGDSASNAILSARTPLIGCYPLKGKPINAMGTDVKKLMENKEFVDLLAITGLKIGKKVNDISELRFGKIVSCTDADADGQHIFGLLSALIKKFWPELLAMGVFHKFVTPIMKVQIGKTEKLFYSLNEFSKWAEENKDKRYSVRYLKGLGSSTAKDFEGYFNNMDKHLVQIQVQDSSDYDIIDLVFGKENGAADKRKEWLQLEDK